MIPSGLTGHYPVSTDSQLLGGIQPGHYTHLSALTCFNLAKSIRGVSVTRPVRGKPRNVSPGESSPGLSVCCESRCLVLNVRIRFAVSVEANRLTTSTMAGMQTECNYPQQPGRAKTKQIKGYRLKKNFWSNRNPRRVAKHFTEYIFLKISPSVLMYEFFFSFLVFGIWGMVLFWL